MLASLFRDLAPFTPVLVGTFPLGLVTAASDIDIACFAPDLDAFERAIHSRLPHAQMRRLDTARVAAFTHDGTTYEVYAEAQPVYAQAGFRHMIVEGRLLAIGGDALRERICAAKRAGLKTEPAFAHVLGLRGDPYAAVLALAGASDATLRSLLARPDAPTTIALHVGERTALAPLFAIADDSPTAVAEYLWLGDVLVATAGSEPVGHVQLIESGPATLELKSLAVAAPYRGTGLGQRLVDAALAHARARGATRVVLSTATADAQLLRFYQRRGFRMTHIDRDIFTPANGYPPDLVADGVPLRDRVWFEIALA